VPVKLTGSDTSSPAGAMRIHWPDGRRLVFSCSGGGILSQSPFELIVSLPSVQVRYFYTGPVCTCARVLMDYRAWYEKGCQKILSAERYSFFSNAAALKSSYWSGGRRLCALDKRLEKGTFELPVVDEKMNGHELRSDELLLF